MSAWRDRRNEKARVRLERALPDAFPTGVLQHARRMPFLPPTPRLCVDSYWRRHPLRADALARALARRSGMPEGWTWRGSGAAKARTAAGFRMPPAPYRDPAHARGPGHCCVCGQPVFRYGWHRDLWGAGKVNKNAAWHACCVVAWQLWTAPRGVVAVLKRRQRHRCPQTNARLLRTAEVDHAVPLYAVWRDRRDLPWPDLLAFWGVPNLQVVNRAAHGAKCLAEAAERMQVRRSARPGADAPASGSPASSPDAAA